MNQIAIQYFLIRRYLTYYWQAQTRYDIHAPFVYALVEAVVEDTRTFYAFPVVEALRRFLLRDDTLLRVEELGAGSRSSARAQSRVREIVRHSAVRPEVGRMLFRLVQFCKPGKMLELGTSLGISAAYQAAAAVKAPLVSIEGRPAVAAIASRNLRQLGLPGVSVWAGTFASRLPEALEHLGTLDYLYIDGDHRKSASLQYFEQCLPYAHADSVFVIADIHWSAEMEEAWQQMKAHARVRLSVDLFHFGILFFREEQRQKRHFTIIKAARKPWRKGFFRGT